MAMSGQEEAAIRTFDQRLSAAHLQAQQTYSRNTKASGAVKEDELFRLPNSSGRLQNCRSWDYRSYLENPNIPLDYKIAAIVINAKHEPGLKSQLSQIGATPEHDLNRPLRTPFARGRNALGIAVMDGNESLVRLFSVSGTSASKKAPLLEKPLDVNTYDDGFTAQTQLHDAIYKPRVMRVLLDRPDIDPNLLDAHGFTPLLSAARTFDLQAHKAGKFRDRYDGLYREPQVGYEGEKARFEAEHAALIATMKMLYEHPETRCQAKDQGLPWGEQALDMTMEEAGKALGAANKAAVNLGNLLDPTISIQTNAVAGDPHSFLISGGDVEKLRAAVMGVSVLDKARPPEVYVGSTGIIVEHAGPVLEGRLTGYSELIESRRKSAAAQR